MLKHGEVHVLAAISRRKKRFAAKNPAKLERYKLLLATGDREEGDDR